VNPEVLNWEQEVGNIIADGLAFIKELKEIQKEYLEAIQLLSKNHEEELVDMLMADYNEVASMVQNLIQKYFEFSDFVGHGELDILKVFSPISKGIQ